MTDVHYAQDHVDDEKLTQWLTFNVNEEIYGVPVMFVREVLRYTKIVPVPGSSREIQGVINLRGTIVPVIDTRSRFNLPSVIETDNTRIIISEGKDGPVGLLVDKVESVCYIKQNEVEATPQVGGTQVEKFIQGVHHRQEKLIMLLNLAEVLNGDDMSFKKEKIED